MRAGEYRDIVRTMVNNALKKRFPGLDKSALKEVADLIAKSVHSRFYGANVDGVASPLWRRDDDPEPNVDAVVLLNREV